jgi:3-dehydroquinate synthase
MSDVVPVALGARAYDVRIGEGLLARAGELIAPFAPRGRVFVVADKRVAMLHGEALSAGLNAAGLDVVGLMIPPGEETKSFQWLAQVCAELIQAGIERRDLVIAFGGGVAGDLVGFASGIVKRGVDFVQIPTTLLAQVDSSVGGKTAIDTPEGKNLVGLFYQPRLVLADLGVLRTLPERELRAGYAEVVKYGLLGDAAFYDWCEANVGKLLACEPEALAYAVRTCVAAKARIVAADEHESGERALLNLGHTFAHALETQTGYGASLLHGEAVAAGMGLAFALSADLGLCTAQDATRVRRHLAAAGFEMDLRKLPGAPYDADALLALMSRDKKAENGKLTLILARAIGAAFVQKDTPAAAIRALLARETS